MIEAMDLCKQFERNVRKEDAAAGKRFSGKTVKEEFLAVDHVSLHAEAGEIVGILGPNGAGKTTLLRMLGMLMTPTAGQVALWEEASENSAENAEDCGAKKDTNARRDRRQITDPIRRKEAIGYLSGNTKLYPRFSIREYLTMMGELYGLSQAEIAKRSEEIFDLLNMGSFADNRIERLSTGQTQRASIARCLMADPRVYILDEPTLGLDILSADAIIRFMQSQKKRGRTVLYSTHYLEEAQTLCDRIYMIDQGRIVAEGTPRELIERTGTESLREAFHIIMEETPHFHL